MTLQKSGESLEFEGVEIRRYYEIETEKMRKHFFFVIKSI